MTLTRLKWVYGGISFVGKMLSFGIGMFLGKESISDLVDLAVGGSMTAISLIHLLPRAEDFISGTYPIAALVAIVVFAVLTLFVFIRDSMTLMDDNMLTSYEAVNVHTTSNTDLLNEQLQTKTPDFDILECVPTGVLYITALLNSIASGIILGSVLDPDVLNKNAGIHIAVCVVEFVLIAKYINALPLPRVAYWILAVITALIEAVLSAIPIEGISVSVMKQMSGYTSAILIGVYVFMGSCCIHNGLTTSKHSLPISAAVLFVSFAIPTVIPPSMRSHNLE